MTTRNIAIAAFVIAVIVLLILLLYLTPRLHACGALPALVPFGVALDGGREQPVTEPSRRRRHHRDLLRVLSQHAGTRIPIPRACTGLPVATVEAGLR